MLSCVHALLALKGVLWRINEFFEAIIRLHDSVSFSIIISVEHLESDV